MELSILIIHYHIWCSLTRVKEEFAYLIAFSAFKQTTIFTRGYSLTLTNLGEFPMFSITRLMSFCLRPVSYLAFSLTTVNSSNVFLSIVLNSLKWYKVHQLQYKTLYYLIWHYRSTFVMKFVVLHIHMHNIQSSFCTMASISFFLVRAFSSILN